MTRQIGHNHALRALAAAVLCACAAPRNAVLAPGPSETDARRARLIASIGGMPAFSEALKGVSTDGALLAGKAVEAAARGEEAEARRLAQAAVDADPGNAARRRLLRALGGDAAPAPAPGPAKPAPPASDARRGRLIERMGGMEAFAELLRLDELDGPLLAGEALEAYAQGSELKAVLLAQAALGADPGNGARRRLLRALEDVTGIAADAEGVLPLAALVQHELGRAEAAFFERRFGAAVQACRRALLLAPDDRQAWLRLGSSYFALGDEARAREAWGKVRDDAALARFLSERGWSGQEMNR